MTFDEWWATQGVLLNLGRDYTVLDLKEIAKRAWDIASQQADSPDQNSRCVCDKCGQPHNYRASKESGGEGSGRDSDLQRY